MNMYEARWANAKKTCVKIQKLLEKGYLIFDADGYKIQSAGIQDDYTFYINSWFYFLNDMNLDNGICSGAKNKELMTYFNKGSLRINELITLDSILRYLKSKIAM